MRDERGRLETTSIGFETLARARSSTSERPSTCAIADPHALLQTLGIALIALGAVIVLATVYLRETEA